MSVKFSRRLLASALLLTATTFSLNTLAAEEILRQPVAKGAYEMAYSPAENALWLATSQSRTLDKGGVVYRLDPQTLAVTQIIHSDIKPFGAAINPQTDILYFGNTLNGSLTAIDGKSGEIKGRVVLDDRQRSETVKPLMPRELVVDATTNTLYMGGLGEQSVIWVVDGDSLRLKHTIADLGKFSTGLAIDPAAKRLYTSNADGEFIIIDTADNKILSRQKLLADDQPHFLLNISLDPASHRAFVTDSKSKALLVVDTRTGKLKDTVAMPESLAVLYNPTRNEIYVTHRNAGEISVVDAKTLKVLKTITAPVHPNSLALSADGKVLYVSVKQASSRKQEATLPDDVLRIVL